MKLVITPDVIRNIDLFESVLRGSSMGNVSKSTGVSCNVLRRGFVKIYEDILLRCEKHLEVARLISEPNKFDLFSMKINREYWLHQLKCLKQHYNKEINKVMKNV